MTGPLLGIQNFFRFVSFPIMFNPLIVKTTWWLRIKRVVWQFMSTPCHFYNIPLSYPAIVKILNLYITLSCTHLYRFYFLKPPSFKSLDIREGALCKLNNPHMKSHPTVTFIRDLFQCVRFNRLYASRRFLLYIKFLMLPSKIE